MADAGYYASGAVDPSTLSLDALLFYRNSGNAFRWNFDQVVGQGVNSNAGIGTGVTLYYSFLTAPAAYMDSNQDNYGNLSSFQGLNSREQAQVRKALDMWSSLANITFQEVTTVAPDSKTLTFGKFDIAASSGAAAYANIPTFAYSTSNGTVVSTRPADDAGDVFFSTSVMARYSDDEIYATALHEIGHALGLSHPFEETVRFPEAAQNTSYSVMAYDEPSNAGWWRTTTSGAQSETVALNVGLLDVAAIQQLYGANTSTNAGDTVYQWDAVQPTRQTIWDGGGTDTIDASNFTLRVEINLNANSFSSIGIRSTEAEMRLGMDPALRWLSASDLSFDGRNNVAIAAGVTIENANGGAARDVLIGNNAVNQLSGGDGDDVLVGNGGNDVLIGGAGFDAAMYNGSRGDYRDGTLTTTLGGTDRLESVEALVFDNRVVTLQDGIFNERFYLETHSDVAAAVAAGAFRSGEEHFTLYGAGEGRISTGLFNRDYYLAKNPDVAAAGVNPFLHFMNYGWYERRDPSALFDTSDYLNTYGDVAAAGINPLSHYLNYGVHEGRMGFIADQSWLLGEQLIG